MGRSAVWKLSATIWQPEAEDLVAEAFGDFFGPAVFGGINPADEHHKTHVARIGNEGQEEAGVLERKVGTDVQTTLKQEPCLQLAQTGS